MFKLAIRNVLRHKARTGMTLMAIIAGVIGLILSGGFVHDIFHQLGETLIHSQTGHLQLSRSGYFEHGARSPEKYLISDMSVLRTEIKGMPEVSDVMGRLFFTGLLNNGRSDLPVIGEGVEPARESLLGTSVSITSGRSLNGQDTYGMMVGQGLAHALKLKPGDQATLVLNTAQGAVNSLDFQVVGVFQSFSREYDARAVRIPLSTAQKLLATTGVNTLVISLKHTPDTDRVAATLNNKYLADGLEVKTWRELNDFYAKTVMLYNVQFGVLRFIILLMVLLSVVNSVNMSAFERVGEFGTMMALGNRGNKVFALIMLESMIIGIAGAVLGVILGVVLAKIISYIGIPMPPPPNSDLGFVAQVRIVPSVIIGAFSVGLIATVTAALLPAFRIRRIPVVDALRQNV